MADVKISQLPVGSAPTTGDAIAIVQSGVTKQIDPTAYFAESPSVKIVHLTASSGTYTPTAGVKALYVECVGGGGGGGGAVSSAGNAAIGSGGGGGGYAAIYITGTIKSSYSYATGAAGAAGSSSGGNGGNGGDTTFDSPSVCTATGGTGGIGLAAGATTFADWSPSPAGAGTVGDFLARGGDGWGGRRYSGTAAVGGQGGSSFFCGMRAAGQSTQSVAGQTAGQYGGGGSGACSLTATGYTGGAGSQGCIRVTEYF